jgi:hypothetical protein
MFRFVCAFEAFRVLALKAVVIPMAVGCAPPDTALPYWSAFYSESLHFVGLAISACLLPSSPRPTCTADSSAALTATAPVPSSVHA